MTAGRTVFEVSEDGGDGLDPVLAVPMGTCFGMLGGIVLGTTVLDDVGLGIVAGMAIGTMLGAVVYALLGRSEGP